MECAKWNAGGAPRSNNNYSSTTFLARGNRGCRKNLSCPDPKSKRNQGGNHCIPEYLMNQGGFQSEA